MFLRSHIHGLSHGLKIARQLSIVAPVCRLVLFSARPFVRLYRKGREPERCLRQNKRWRSVCRGRQMRQAFAPTKLPGTANGPRLHFVPHGGTKLRCRWGPNPASNSPPDCCDLIFRVPSRPEGEINEGIPLGYPLIYLVHRKGLEPPTLGTGIRCSIH